MEGEPVAVAQHRTIHRRLGALRGNHHRRLVHAAGFCRPAAAARIHDLEISGGEDPGILLLGNSLTLTDLDLQTLEASLGTKCSIHRWAIDDTNYLDWYYGFRRVARMGAKPHYVVVGAHGNHLLAKHVRGRFFAHYILDWQDLANAASVTGADANAFSNMALAQISAFYGSREEIFKRWLSLVLPFALDRISSANVSTTISNMSAGELGNAEIPLPPISIQGELAERMDILISSSDALIAACTEMIKTLNERRQSLISAAVTGKIDVRKVA